MTGRAECISTDMLDSNEPRTAYRVLAAVSFCHLLNDMLQSAIPAAYPIFKSAYHLDFGQIGVITLATSQASASLLQPVVGTYTDRRPLPYSLAAHGIPARCRAPGTRASGPGRSG